MMFLGIIIFLLGLYLVLNPQHSHFDFFRQEDKALDIVRERYARGELTTEEFQAMCDTLS